MGLELGALREALIEAGASSDKARAAAEEAAAYGSVESDLLLLKWMVGSIIALNLAMAGTLWRLVTHA